MWKWVTEGTFHAFHINYADANKKMIYLVIVHMGHVFSEQTGSA